MLRLSSYLGSIILAASMATCGAHALVGPAVEDSSFAAYTVMVLKSSAAGSSFCSGVVVARNVVLTAGHCVARAADTLVHFRESSGAPTMRRIDDISVHPQYRANSVRTRERSIDLALVRLSEPLPDRFRAAAIADVSAISVGARFRIAGYGVNREGAGNSGGVLRSGVLVAREPLSSILLWAEDPRKQGLGACEGDSGGPVFSIDFDTLVAIIDWAAGIKGKGCGGLTQGALVAPQRAWIESVLRSWRNP